MKKVFYLYKNGELLQKDYSLVLKDKNSNNIYLPIEQIDTIICFSNITLNKQTLALLNRYKIVILFFNFYGQYIGKFSPKKYFDGKLLIEQINAFNQKEKREYIAYKIIYSSLKNCLALLKYYDKKGINLEKEILSLVTIIDNYLAKNIDALLILEANAKKIYYSCFDKILNSEKFKFNKRTKNLPENEINALISYGYALLYGNYLAVLDRSRLYSQISYIHSISKCNESLHFDLADILKPVLIDRLILSICRHNELKKEYFEFKEDRCYLNKQGVIFFVEKYENYLLKTIKINNHYYSYRNLISREVHLLSNYLAHESKEYKPYIMRW